MINENIITLIANDTGLSVKAVGNTIELLEEGCTIPFIARYRKERTGGLSEVEIARICKLNDKYKELAKRKETIIATIEG
ncbi:MAG: RNA-binding transcriptional accessory protein, partial [Prevotella sp.]|nr:RNA-binding transcriptional accessory protein [Prevotella sp.]